MRHRRSIAANSPAHAAFSSAPSIVGATTGPERRLKPSAVAAAWSSVKAMAAAVTCEMMRTAH
eukprot:2324733-Prymnesium_polylepis.2